MFQFHDRSYRSLCVCWCVPVVSTLRVCVCVCCRCFVILLSYGAMYIKSQRDAMHINELSPPCAYNDTIEYIVVRFFIYSLDGFVLLSIVRDLVVPFDEFRARS